MRSQTFEIPPQEVESDLQGLDNVVVDIQILTKDSVTVFVNAIMYYRSEQIFSLNISIHGIEWPIRFTPWPTWTTTAGRPDCWPPPP